ncbi:MAG: AbrB/MazE/SpoVT family DNA-binding domain-containing protein [Candidatus Diapherotrites archaeon]
MYETICVIGERGQITIPKTIREIKGMNPKEKVIVKIENDKIVVEKKLSKKEKEELMKEYYIKHAKENDGLAKEMESVSMEASRFLDDY